MKPKRFPEEFKIEAVRQIVERGHSVLEVSARLGVSTHSLYKWVKELQLSPGQRQEQHSQAFARTYCRSHTPRGKCIGRLATLPKPTKLDRCRAVKACIKSAKNLDWSEAACP